MNSNCVLWHVHKRAQTCTNVYMQVKCLCEIAQFVLICIYMFICMYVYSLYGIHNWFHLNWTEKLHIQQKHKRTIYIVSYIVLLCIVAYLCSMHKSNQLTKWARHSQYFPLLLSVCSYEILVSHCSWLLLDLFVLVSSIGPSLCTDSEPVDVDVCCQNCTQKVQ